MIKQKYIDRFKELHKIKYNIELSDEEATDQATHFLNLMRILIRQSKVKTQT